MMKQQVVPFTANDVGGDLVLCVTGKEVVKAYVKTAEAPVPLTPPVFEKGVGRSTSAKWKETFKTVEEGRSVALWIQAQELMFTRKCPDITREFLTREFYELRADSSYWRTLASKAVKEKELEEGDFVMFLRDRAGVLCFMVAQMYQLGEPAVVVTLDDLRPIKVKLPENERGMSWFLLQGRTRLRLYPKDVEYKATEDRQAPARKEKTPKRILSLQDLGGAEDPASGAAAAQLLLLSEAACQSALADAGNGAENGVANKRKWSRGTNGSGGQEMSDGSTSSPRSSSARQPAAPLLDLAQQEPQQRRRRTSPLEGMPMMTLKPEIDVMALLGAHGEPPMQLMHGGEMAAGPWGPVHDDSSDPASQHPDGSHQTRMKADMHLDHAVSRQQEALPQGIHVAMHPHPALLAAPTGAAEDPSRNMAAVAMAYGRGLLVELDTAARSVGREDPDRCEEIYVQSLAVLRSLLNDEPMPTDDEICVILASTGANAAEIARMALKLARPQYRTCRALRALAAHCRWDTVDDVYSCLTQAQRALIRCVQMLQPINAGTAL